MEAMSKYTIEDEFKRLQASPEVTEDAEVGEEVVLLTCEECNAPTLIKDAKGNEIYNECDCRAKKRERNRMKLFEDLSIIDRNSGRDIFKNAVFDSKKEKELYRRIFQYCKDFEKVQEFNAGLLFTGPPGNGKTFLANCVCNYLKKCGYSVLSFSFGGYLEKIKDSYGVKQSPIESKLIKAIREADMLFIDDLGSEQMTEDWGKAKLYRLIDERYRAGKPIMITTNLTPKQMEERFNYGNVDKITDRLYQMTKMFAFTWPTKRRKKNNYWED